MSHEVLTIEQMYEADRRTMAEYSTGMELMENAGRACADVICDEWNAGVVAILCGPGNNGGDGFVIARHLKERGWLVKVSLLEDRQKLTGDAAAMADRWAGDIAPFDDKSLAGASLVVDAVFGAGLSKPIEGVVAQLFSRMAELELPVMAVDMPSGVDGDTGQIKGVAPRADRTVTFCRPKVGHLLMPGREHCGELVVADIGIPDRVITDQHITTRENGPEVWRQTWPGVNPHDHKYSRGHTLVVSGGASSTGAARMVARGALRIGSGLVTIACPPDALNVNAAQLTAIMVRSFDNVTRLGNILEDARKNVVAIGPGCGVNHVTRNLVKTVLGAQRATVLDADALTSFENNPADLIEIIDENVVLTPHEGEFRRLFPEELGNAPEKLTAARQAAARSGAIMVLKGMDTVIAHPSGHAVINSNAPAYLATAGAGDVLAGFIAGLLAQHMPVFDAACAAVWLHGQCGTYLGRGLIAEDLPEVLPDVLQDLDSDLSA